MEIAEAIGGVKKTGNAGRRDDVLPSDELGNVFHAGAADRTPPNGWRRIEDELPEVNRVVLVCFNRDCDGATVRTMAYRVGPPLKCAWSTDLAYEDPNWGYVDDIKVTHWMPLPDPPF